MACSSAETQTQDRFQSAAGQDCEYSFSGLRRSVAVGRTCTAKAWVDKLIDTPPGWLTCQGHAPGQSGFG